MRISLNTLRALPSTLHYGSRLRPARDWLLMLAAAALLLVASGLWNAKIFFAVENGEVLGSIIRGHEGAAFDTSGLTKAAALFESRAAQEAAYTSGARSFVDPSK